MFLACFVYFCLTFSGLVGSGNENGFLFEKTERNGDSIGNVFVSTLSAHFLKIGHFKK